MTGVLVTNRSIQGFDIVMMVEGKRQSVHFPARSEKLLLDAGVTPELNAMRKNRVFCKVIREES